MFDISSSDLVEYADWIHNLAGFLLTLCWVIGIVLTRTGLGIKSCRSGTFRGIMIVLTIPFLLYVHFSNDVELTLMVNTGWVILLLFTNSLYELWDKHSTWPYFHREFMPENSGMYLICRSEKSAVNWSWLSRTFWCKPYLTVNNKHVAYKLWAIDPEVD